MKKILYLDMDNTLVDFRSGIDALKPDDLRRYEGRYDDAPGIFRLMVEPMEGALEAFREPPCSLIPTSSPPPLGRTPRPGATSCAG
nr:hypothetical protein [Pelodictyon luteolum]